MQECYNFYQNRLSFRLGFFMIIFLLLSVGCDSEDPAPEVSHIEVNTDFVRFDSLLFSLESSEQVSDYTHIKRDYPAFSELYLHRILGLPRQNDSLMHSKLVDIARAPAIQSLSDSISRKYDNLGAIKSDFRRAFQFYQYYFPEFSTPAVYFCFTEFAVGTFLFESAEGKDALGLSLDMFLGPTFPYGLLAQRETSFSQYLIRTFTSEHMVRKALEVLIEDKVKKSGDERLLDYMVDRGRTLYIVKQLVPSMPDSILFEYSTEQTQWCRDNELAMWAHILDKELLYERKMKLISTMITPAPTTMGMPPQSPGRTSDFIGYQIIDQFVENTDISLEELLSLTDAQEVLKRSRYKGQNIQ